MHSSRSRSTRTFSVLLRRQQRAMKLVHSRTNLRLLKLILALAATQCFASESDSSATKQLTDSMPDFKSKPSKVVPIEMAKLHTFRTDCSTIKEVLEESDAKEEAAFFFSDAEKFTKHIIKVTKNIMENKDFYVAPCTGEVKRTNIKLKTMLKMHKIFHQANTAREERQTCFDEQISNIRKKLTKDYEVEGFEVEVCGVREAIGNYQAVNPRDFGKSLNEVLPKRIQFNEQDPRNLEQMVEQFEKMNAGNRVWYKQVTAPQVGCMEELYKKNGYHYICYDGVCEKWCLCNMDGQKLYWTTDTNLKFPTRSKDWEFGNPSHFGNTFKEEYEPVPRLEMDVVEHPLDPEYVEEKVRETMKTMDNELSPDSCVPEDLAKDFDYFQEKHKFKNRMVRTRLAIWLCALYTNTALKSLKEKQKISAGNHDNSDKNAHLCATILNHRSNCSMYFPINGDMTINRESLFPHKKKTEDLEEKTDVPLEGKESDDDGFHSVQDVFNDVVKRLLEVEEPWLLSSPADIYKTAEHSSDSDNEVLIPRPKPKLEITKKEEEHAKKEDEKMGSKSTSGDSDSSGIHTFDGQIVEVEKETNGAQGWLAATTKTFNGLVSKLNILGSGKGNSGRRRVLQRLIMETRLISELS